MLKELEERRDRIRIPLLILASSHPSPEVRDLAGQLEVELATMLTSTTWFVFDLLHNTDTASTRSDANQHHAEALRLLDRLLEAIHEPETGPPPLGRLGRLSQRRQLPGRR